MIYPSTFEQKTGFSEIRSLLKNHCLSTLGKEEVDGMTCSTDAAQIGEWLRQVSELRRIKEESDDVAPMQ
jgi:DNA mismatch repair protein MutS2